MKRPTRTATQLRHQYLLRLADEAAPERIHKGTEHQSREVSVDYDQMISPMICSKPVASKLVYDKPDLKKLRRLRRLFKSRSSGQSVPPGRPLRQGRRQARKS
jgi:hypothetical protein